MPRQMSFHHFGSLSLTKPIGGDLLGCLIACANNMHAFFPKHCASKERRHIWALIYAHTRGAKKSHDTSRLSSELICRLAGTTGQPATDAEQSDSIPGWYFGHPAAIQGV